MPVNKKELTDRINNALRLHNRFILAKVRSQSHPDNKHLIRLSADHTIYCDCQGWQFSKKDPKTCRHLELFKQKFHTQEL